MSRVRWVGPFVLLLVAMPAWGQFFPQPVPVPVPVYYPYVPPSGLGFYYQTGRFRIGGFLPITTPYTSVSNNVTFSVAGPTTYVVTPRFVAVEDFYNGVGVNDITGIDLDAKPLARNPPPGIEERVQVKPAAPAVQPKPQPAQPEQVAVLQKNPDPPAKLPPLPPDLPPPAKTASEEHARLLDMGRAAFQEQLYGLAAMRFQQAVAVAPAEPKAYFLLSQAQFALGRYQDAVKTIADGMRLRAGWPSAGYQLRGDVFKGAEDNLTGFMKMLQDAAMRNPNNATYDFLVAHQLWFDGQRDAALTIFRRIRTTAPQPELVDAFLKSGNLVAAQ